jgi:hypothetical protein
VALNIYFSACAFRKLYDKTHCTKLSQSLLQVNHWRHTRLHSTVFDQSLAPWTLRLR